MRLKRRSFPERKQNKGPTQTQPMTDYQDRDPEMDLEPETHLQECNPAILSLMQVL